ncbi:hypothetical protein ETZ49_18535 [Acinetobacter baumannii]|nr:hypothetical protein [Acinetobacter baumannii]MBP3071902.1 hypothetical protein [Acinetobacter baumannii]NAO24873.1 hypothetical protein [Acinetobacter baumannii]TDA54656.1 hypothetical protein ETP77_18020 [Acinetobacter baumannii]TDA55114.1 hypothetical protein ETZ49_18535 [Acinetobacter baumannii]
MFHAYYLSNVPRFCSVLINIIRFFGESLFHVLALKLAHQKTGVLANHKEGKNGSGNPFF